MCVHISFFRLSGLSGPCLWESVHPYLAPGDIQILGNLFSEMFFIVFVIVFVRWINSDTIFWENAPFAACHCCCFCVFVFVFLRGDIQIPRDILFWEVCQFADFPASDIRILVVSHLGLTFWQSIDVSILIFRSHLSFCFGSMSPS